VKPLSHNDLQSVVDENPYDGFLAFMTRKGMSKRTIETYLNAVKTFENNPYFAGFKNATVSEIAAYQEYLVTGYRSNLGNEISLVTVTRMMSSLRSFYDYLKLEKLVFENPARKVRLPKTPKRIRGNDLTVKDVQAMVNLPCINLKELRDIAVVHFLAATGVRATACGRIKLDEIYPDRLEGLVIGGKGDKDRLIFFTSRCRIMLANYIENARRELERQKSDYLFLSDTGKPLDRAGINQIVKRAAKRAGLKSDVSSHLLRHWLCTVLLEDGVNLRIVSEVAGHERLSTTSRYAHVSLELMRKSIDRFHPKGRG
jgi:site-specific recombinase XerD